MEVKLDKDDLIALVKGSSPNFYGHTFRGKEIFKVDGFPNESIRWNDQSLKQMSSIELWECYQEIKKIKNA